MFSTSAESIPDRLLGDGELYGSVVLDASGKAFGVTAGGPYPYPNDGVAFESMP